MSRLIPVIFLLSPLIFSCSKNSADFTWEKSFGTGKALFTKASPDSGVVVSGVLGGKQYLIRLDKNKNKVAEYKSTNSGQYNSLWFDTSCYIAGGSSEGKMFLIRLDRDCKPVWEKSFSKNYYMDCTSVCYLGNGNILAVGSASADSSHNNANGILFVWLDTAGTVISQKEIKETSFISANNAVVDNSGNVYLALTRKNTGSKLKASVAKFNDQLQKFWETELYNNPDFGAASLGIKLDNSGNVYVSGRTELSSSTGIINDSFLASLTNTGDIRWKKHLEVINSGSSMTFDYSGRVIIINRNCCIIDLLNTEDGSESGRIRVFDVCDSNNTDAFGFDLDLNYDGNILLAGSKGGGFFLALKSYQPLPSP